MAVSFIDVRRRLYDQLQVRLGRAIPGGRLKRALAARYFRATGRCARALLVSPGDTVVQVGTPNTRTIDRLVGIIGRQGRLIVVEAMPQTAARLQEYATARGYENVTVIARGAWSERGTMPLLLASRASDNRLQDPEVLHDNDMRDSGYRSEVMIPVDTLDEIWSACGIASADYVEITVNGAELHVLRGMQHSLPHARSVFVKAHGRRSDSGRPLTEDIAAYLQSRGFLVVEGKKTPSVAEDWGLRDPDVLAWPAEE